MSAQIYNLDAEISCLSSIIYDDKNYDLISSRITNGDFYDGKNKVIADAIWDYKKINGDKVLDVLSLTDYLKANNDLEKAGGVGYITKLLDNYISSVNLETYTAIISEKSLFRNLKKVSSDLNLQLSSPSRNTFTKDILEGLQNQLYQLEKKQYGEYVNINDLAKPSVKEIEKNLKEQLESSKLGIDYICRGVSTGFRELDKIISGLQKTHLIILGGRTGMGKTLFMCALAQNIGINKEGSPKAVGIFSLEMSQEELTNRILFSESKISYNDFKMGKLLEDAEGWRRMTDTVSILQDPTKASIFIDDTSRRIHEIEATARRMVRENKVEVIFIDYIQFITPDKDQMRMPREQQIATFSNELKQMAKRLKIPVIALAQLNREVEKKGTNDRKPQLAHLRDSGALEQDADIVMFVYRDSYYHDKISAEDNSDESEYQSNVNLNEEGKQQQQQYEQNLQEKQQMMKNVIEILVRKNRHGETGNVFLKCNLSQFYVEDIRDQEYLEKLKSN